MTCFLAMPFIAIKQLPINIVSCSCSAHWCPPCRGFTPKLAAWYEKHCLPGKDLHGKVDIVFASSDKSESEFKGYLSEMPWKAIAFDNRKLKAELSEAFQVEGIPTLVFINAKSGALITSEGRSKIESAPEDYPWPPKAVDSLEGAMSYINDTAVCIVFAENATNPEAEVAASEALAKVAAEYFKDGVPSDKLRFAFSSSEDEGPALTIRRFVGGAHAKDKTGPDAIRVTILDVPNRSKALFKDGKLGPVDAAELSAFCKAYVEGSAKVEGIKG